MNGWAGGLKDGRVGSRRTYGRANGQTGRRKERRSVGRADERTDGRTGWQTGGRTGGKAGRRRVGGKRGGRADWQSGLLMRSFNSTLSYVHAVIRQSTLRGGIRRRRCSAFGIFRRRETSDRQCFELSALQFSNATAVAAAASAAAAVASATAAAASLLPPPTPTPPPTPHRGRITRSCCCRRVPSSSTILSATIHRRLACAERLGYNASSSEPELRISLLARIRIGRSKHFPDQGRHYDGVLGKQKSLNLRKGRHGKKIIIYS